ncbi:maleylpyruvate isomerase family mycothiol-dependent enzyme [Geodermatophilus sp. YIM 151500]|uniref:maleylpyruvate isomerase family mycothiol-dependent enzyme n=1 Tax=Geodermatophilus sp. YIM 151500 TaxID=2984531 RepID=UPI0021E4DB11|nr:maleylpyruvate isomerase family mycothiol-dependent enzyme [Geodermatophilus sp. YIM 151500]MCV2489326.1 maleylpyruvate isomerase family mycothiol-dependent enzyme [Geodermatophilus sp. YIM 151500]
MHELAAARTWADEGTALFLAALARTGDDALAGPTALPGWTGAHLVAHVAGNAEALLNLARWAATGQETPMYSSPAQRAADIEAGARRTPVELRRWVAESAARLAGALDALTGEQWCRPVRTAQGRPVPATGIPWLRAREVLVHAVDLDPRLGFAGLPGAFLLALVDDVVTRRSGGDQPALVLTADGRRSWEVTGHGDPTAVHGSLAGVAAYLTGRPGGDVTSPSGAVPDLPPWL